MNIYILVYFGVCVFFLVKLEKLAVCKIFIAHYNRYLISEFEYYYKDFRRTFSW